MINLFNGLYYQYFKWQVKVGNKGVAPFFSFLNVYLGSFFWFLAFLFWSLLLDGFCPILDNINGNIIYLVSFFIAVTYYFMFLHKKKYLVIMNKGHIYGKRNMRVFAIVFPIVGFILFNLGWILKMFQNRGDL